MPVAWPTDCRTLALTQGRNLIEPASDADRFLLFGLEGQLFDGLPYYLDDLRPQGFLGREIPARWRRPIHVIGMIRGYSVF